MAPQDETLKIGDVVEVVNMPDSSGMNGIVGTLLKTVGKGRWAVKVEGDDRSKVVSVENLQKQASQPKKAQGATAPKNYSIVGTWDDWEPNEMSWNAESECFEYRVIMGDSGSESFKVLLNADWDTCVYPDRKDASPHVDHAVLGPDDGGLDEEWTIGLDSKDSAAEGTVYKVRMYVHPDGRPKSVGWETLRKEGSTQQQQQPQPQQQPAPAPAPIKKEEPVTEMAKPQGGFSRDVNAGSYKDTAPRWEQPSSFYADPSVVGGGGQNFAVVEDAETRRAGERILRQEREARERLARRLEDAAEVLLPAIADGDVAEEGTEKEEQRMLLRYSDALQAHQHQHQISVNLERYRTTCDENSGPPQLELVVRRDDDELYVESGKEAEASRKEGWDPTSMCGGLTAARRVEELVSDGTLSRPMARQYIMKKYPGSFQH